MADDGVAGLQNAPAGGVVRDGAVGAGLDHGAQSQVLGGEIGLDLVLQFQLADPGPHYLNQSEEHAFAAAMGGPEELLLGGRFAQTRFADQRLGRAEFERRTHFGKSRPRAQPGAPVEAELAGADAGVGQGLGETKVGVFVLFPGVDGGQGFGPGHRRSLESRADNADLALPGHDATAETIRGGVPRAREREHVGRIEHEDRRELLLTDQLLQSGDVFADNRLGYLPVIGVHARFSTSVRSMLRYTSRGGLPRRERNRQQSLCTVALAGREVNFCW